MKSKNFYRILILFSSILIILSLFYPYAYFKKLNLTYIPASIFQHSNIYTLITEHSSQLAFIPLLYPYFTLIYLLLHMIYFHYRKKKSKFINSYTITIFSESYFPFFINMFIYITYYFKPFQNIFIKVIGIFIISINLILTYRFFKAKLEAKTLSEYLTEKYLLYGLHFLAYFSILGIILYLNSDQVKGGFFLCIAGYIGLFISFFHKKNTLKN